MDIVTVEAKPKGLEMDIDRERFGLALKTWRLRHDLTQRQLAARWGISRYTVMRAEKGKDITWPMAYRMFAKLSVELENDGRAAR